MAASVVDGDAALEVDVASSSLRDRPHNEHDMGSAETDNLQRANQTDRLIGRHLMGKHLMGRRFMSMHLMGKHLIGRHLMGKHLMGRAPHGHAPHEQAPHW
jgi:hypothetical protein